LLKKAWKIVLAVVLALLVVVLGYVAYVFIDYHRIGDQELTVERSRRCTWDAITAAELTEPEPGRRPSLVLCRPKKGESLWELAKRYRTDEQAICAANGLEQETPLPSGLLLIPRVR
jgi:hypothetical protein